MAFVNAPRPLQIVDFINGRLGTVRMVVTQVFVCVVLVMELEKPVRVLGCR